MTEPSFLTEDGTWPLGNDHNYARIGTEMIKYKGITDKPPYTLQNVTRGDASKAVAHKAGDELAKLQMNCYHGYVPDMKLLLDYAEYYANLMHRNEMDSIDFDGLESVLYQNHGYYGVRVFMRRLFETYAKLTGGKYPHVTGSNVFSGAWEYMDACNVGGGNNMFDPVGNRWGIEGKDMRNAFSSSYYPATFGIQGWRSDWSVSDAENLQAKAIGWDATYALSTSQNEIERSGEKDAIIKTFRAWQNARAASAFTKDQKKRLQDSGLKFHLDQTGDNAFVLYPVKEIKIADSAGNEAKSLAIANPYGAQPLQFALRMGDAAKSCVIALSGGSQIKCNERMRNGQYIICKGDKACLADSNRKKIAELALDAADLPPGESRIGVQFPAEDEKAKVPFDLTVWVLGKGEGVGKRGL